MDETINNGPGGPSFDNPQTSTAPDDSNSSGQGHQGNFSPPPAPVQNTPDYSNDPLSADQIRDILHFDPVEALANMKKNQAPAQPKPPAQAQQTPQNQNQNQNPQQTPPTQTPQNQQAPAQPAPADPVQAQLAALTQLTQQLAQSQQQQQPQNQQPQNQPPAGPSRIFNTQLPPEVFAALESDDINTRRAAMNETFNGFANLVFNTMGQYLSQQVVPALRQEMQQTYHVQSQAQTTQEKFYSANPNLNNPYIRPIVQQIATEVLAEQQAAGTFRGFDDAFNQAVAEKTYALTAIPRTAAPGNSQPPVAPVSGQPGQPVIQAQTNPPVQVPGRNTNAPFFTGQGARPPVAPNNLSAEITDTLGIVRH